MDYKMHGESPQFQFKKCCFCLPLRKGLLGWGYARLVIDILIIIFLVPQMFMLLAFKAPSGTLLGFLAILALFVTDVAFTVLLIFSCHKKDSKRLHISYIYSILWVFLAVAFGVFALIHEVNRPHISFDFKFVTSCVLFFVVVFMQLYVILLLRSEVIKLQNRSAEMQFTNNASEAEARFVPAKQRGIDDGGYPVLYTNDAHDASVQN